MINCQFCGKEIENKRHEGLCGKNPQRRGIKKGGKHKKVHNDKTAGKKVTIPPIESPSEADNGLLSASPVESKILKEINLNKEFENMSEKFKGGSDAEKEKKYKYKCECGEYFNIPAKNEAGENCCPFCGR